MCLSTVKQKMWSIFL
uniref:Uncharacterized protein n=1 Tax=Arundo donax TaxID=35708 RepID=A0A0A9DCI0_ARUDO